MGYQVFISYKHTTLDGTGVTRDYTIASELHSALTRAGVKTFFSEKDLSTGDYINEIYDAIEEADILIVVGTKSEHIRSRWVKEEWSTFIAEINGGRKPNGDVYTYLEGMTVNELPSLLFKRQSYNTNEIDRLIGRISLQLGIESTETSVSLQNTNLQIQQAFPSESLINVHVGDIIQFGQYPQGATGEIQPIDWRVLAVENGRALIITDKLLDCVKYNETRSKVTWEVCTLRKWLNNEFFSRAFSFGQQGKILSTTNHNKGNTATGTEGGNDTQDKVFVLSVEEAKKFLSSSNNFTNAHITDYAYFKGFNTKDHAGFWWLRSPGFSGESAAFVSSGGSIGNNGMAVNNVDIAVRPALWMSL